MKIVVLERESMGADIDISCFEDFGEMICYQYTAPEEVAERTLDADIIIANKTPLNESTLKEAKNLKLICEFATGYNNVDLEYCKKHDIHVTNAVGYSTPTVAQHTFAMLFYLLEKLPTYDRYVKSGAYTNSGNFTCFTPAFPDLAGKTWGIVGLGNIGRKVADIATAFGCKVIFYSASGNNTTTDYERVDFDTLLQESDIVSLHCPLTNLTENLFDEKAFSKMKKNAVLLNVARGPVVNQEALYDALTTGKIAAAGLDVLTKEPITKDNPLAKITDCEKLLITPHMAWGSNEARCRCTQEVYQNIQSFLQGGNRNQIV